ncbi:MAG TPA: hypothetical protein VJ767_11250 [Nitrososphaeraceae archaeon]|nr:hypothetical protein [Nitrososphaeraceae archaeon]
MIESHTVSLTYADFRTDGISTRSYQEKYLYTQHPKGRKNILKKIQEDAGRSPSTERFTVLSTDESFSFCDYLAIF